MMRQDAMNNAAQKTDAEQPIAVTMTSSKTPKHALELRVLPPGVSLLTEALSAFGVAYGQSMMGKKLREKFRKTRAEKVLHATNTYKRVAKVLATLNEEVRYTLTISERSETPNTPTVMTHDQQSIADHVPPPAIAELLAMQKHMEPHRPALMSWRVYGRHIAALLAMLPAYAELTKQLRNPGVTDLEALPARLNVLRQERQAMTDRLKRFTELLQPFATARDQTLVCTLERLLKELVEYRQDSASLNTDNKS